VSAQVFYSGITELATCSNVFKVSGTPTDPTAATLTITDPGGTVTTYNYPGGPNTLTRTGTGAFKQDVPSALDGIWAGAWTGTAPASDVVAFTWTVQPTTVGQYYCTAEELKDRLGITDTSDDSQVIFACQSAARAIEGACGRYFWRGADTRTYVPESMWSLTTDDIVSVTTLKTDSDGDGVFETTWNAATDYELSLGERAYNTGASGEQRPYTRINVVSGAKLFPFTWAFTRQDRIQVTGVFGWPAIPPAIRQAAMQLAAQFFKMKDAPFGFAGMSDLGIVRVQASPQIYALIQPYVRGAKKVGV
jgi:hypothetical protein